jgi:hypothetical protein
VIAAVDPGIDGCGVATFSGDGALQSACYVPSASGETSGQRIFYAAAAVARRLEARTIDRLIVERPRVYAGRRLNPDGLLLLAEIGACLAGLLDRVPVQYRPHEWKGNVDADVMTRRVRQRLSTREFCSAVLPHNTCPECARRNTREDCLKPHSCLAHNVWDAVGLGLKFLGRLERERVVHR